MMKNAYLIGTQIYLRPLERADAPAVVQWLNDPDVTRTLQMYRPLTLHMEEEFIEQAAKSDHDLVLGVNLKPGDKLIGVTGLHRIDFKNRHAAFGIFIGEKDHWGKGCGTEATYLMTKHAFETLNLNRVWLHVYENNERAVRTYVKVGFKEEGRLRQDRYSEGRYWDTITMAILRSEWTKGK